jgi:threonine aldolase
MSVPIELRSDNAAGVAPEILAALEAANSGSALAYGADKWSADLQALVRDVFEHSHATVFPVLTGTAANSLALAAMCPQWGAVLCHESAHVLQNECGSTSLFSGGAVLRGLPGEGFRITPATLEQAFENTRWGDHHNSQPKVLSLTEPTDFGTLYTPAHIAELAGLAHARGLKVHLDGARIANAIAALGCSPAELTWRAGVDVFTLGATKNGALSTDAIVCFDPTVTAELYYLTKRSGHVASKMRFQSAQLQAYLRDGLWLRLAASANAAMTRLTHGLRTLGFELVGTPEVNIAFVRADEAVIDRMEKAGLLFYREGERLIRLVTSFQTTRAEVDDALGRIQSALTG